MILIPMNNQPNQTFAVTIPRGSNNIRLLFNMDWNDIAGFWQTTISNIETQTELINRMPLVNPFPLVQYGYFDIGQAFITKIGNTTRNYPGVDDWGRNFAMFWE